MNILMELLVGLMGAAIVGVFLLVVWSKLKPLLDAQKKKEPEKREFDDDMKKIEDIAKEE